MAGAKKKPRGYEYSGSEVSSDSSSSDNDERSAGNNPANFPDSLFMKRKSSHKRKGFGWDISSSNDSSDGDDDKDDDVGNKILKDNKSDKGKSKTKTKGKSTKEKKVPASEKKKKKSGNSKHSKKYYNKHDAKKKGKRGSFKEPFAGKAMPRKQSNHGNTIIHDDSNDNNNHGGSFLDTLEKLMSTEEGSRIIAKNVKPSRSLEEHKTYSKSSHDGHPKKSSPDKHSKRKHSNRERAIGGIDGISQSERFSFSSNRGSRRDGRSASLRSERSSIQAPLSAGAGTSKRSLYDTLYVPSFPTFGGVRSLRQERTIHDNLQTNLLVRHTTEKSGGNNSKRKNRSTALDHRMSTARSNDDDHRERSTRSTRSSHASKKQHSFHDRLDNEGSTRSGTRTLNSSNRQRNTPDRLGSMSNHKRESSSGRRKRDEENSRSFNASLPDRLDFGDTNDDSDGRDDPGKRGRRTLRDDSSVSVPDSFHTMVPPSACSSPESPSGRIKQHMEIFLLGSTSGQHAGEAEGEKVNPANNKTENTGKRKTDVDLLLMIMSPTQARDLYFTEVGFFDWKKWKKLETQKTQQAKKGMSKKKTPRRQLYDGESSHTRSKTKPRRQTSRDNNHGASLNSHRGNPTHSVVNEFRLTEPEPDWKPGVASRVEIMEKDAILGCGDWTQVLVKDNKHLQSHVIPDFGIFGENKDCDDIDASNKGESTAFSVEIKEKKALKQREMNPAHIEEPVLPSKKHSRVTTSQLIGLEGNVDDMAEEPTAQLTRQDSAARELNKLATFMTSIDVLSNQEVKQPEPKLDEKQMSCCVIL